MDCVTFSRLGAMWGRRHPDRTDVQVGCEVHRAVRWSAPPQDVLDASAAAAAKHVQSLTATEARTEPGHGAAASSEGGCSASEARPSTVERSVPLSTALAMAQAAVLTGRQTRSLTADAADIAEACMRAALTGGDPLPAVSPMAMGKVSDVVKLAGELMQEKAVAVHGDSADQCRRHAPGAAPAKQGPRGNLDHGLPVKRESPAEQQARGEPAARQQQQQRRERRRKRKCEPAAGRHQASAQRRKTNAQKGAVGRAATEEDETRISGGLR